MLSNKEIIFNTEFTPRFYRRSVPTEKTELDSLLNEQPGIVVYDTILKQLKELVECRQPHKRFNGEELQQEIEKLLAAAETSDYGVWVYYAWNNKLVHILDEKEFTELRTNRNHYKITPEEQATLATKKIAIIGLSVGQSVALTIAMERLAGELRLADFDELDLSNCNRIRTSLTNIGLKKTTITAREIAEIDPFIKVVCYNDGITAENLDDFLTGNGQVDVMIDECDSIDIKLLSRVKAKSYRIPVVMDTSDRGMLDIERFDIEPQRPLLHGLAEGIDPIELAKLSPQEKLPFIMKIIDIQGLSERSKWSLSEIGKSLKTWPQLASAVIMGGGITADTVRKILLKQSSVSGRFFIDLDKLII